MQDTLIDPDVAEDLGIKYSNTYALSRGWTYDGLKEPEEDLKIFFDNLPGSKMLDVGCGWARYVYRFIDHGIDYVGIDHSPEMVAVAREEYPDKQFELMSYRKLEFPDESFDALWCCCTFGGEPKHNMPKVLEGLKRILVTGGVMMVVMPAMNVSDEEMATTADGKPLLHHSFYELTELVKLLEAAGFSTVESTQHWHHGAMSVLVKKKE